MSFFEIITLQTFIRTNILVNRKYITKMVTNETDKTK